MTSLFFVSTVDFGSSLPLARPKINMSLQKILAVDDEPQMRRVLETVAGKTESSDEELAVSHASAGTLRTANDSITRLTPLMIMLTPTKTPIAHAELDGHCR